MELKFYKYHGAGNDFIMIDNRERFFNPEATTITKLCHRFFGIGADGLILLEHHPEADFRMRYFNSDGREATMCGNGGRCCVAFARFLGLVKSDANFIAADGRHVAVILSEYDTSVVVKLKMSDVVNIQKFDEGFFLDTGSPHLVRFIENVNDLDVNAEGRKIRTMSKWGTDGVNVNFVELKSGDVHGRTYERGVENETLSCGTGAIAMALAVYSNGFMTDSPLLIHAPGGQLKVHFNAVDHYFSNIWLEGPAERVFEGKIQF
ncbi:MAG: diaminopimelate epimerase [Bacteroidales bacterium]|nr:diaminopimelate epimerase [Bacteroidales bacterium]